MLTDPAAPRERDDAAHQMRLAVGQVLRDLHHLPKVVRKVRATMPPPQDPVSLDRLLESHERALRHADRAAAALGDGGRDGVGATGPHALADVHELVEEVRAGLAAPRILDDVGEMLAEAPTPPAARALRALDSRARRIGTQADRLFTLAVAAPQDFSPGAKPMSSSPSAGPAATASDPTADAVRDLGEMLATTLSGGGGAAPSSARATGRRHAAVADQLAASLDAYGLPHDGVQLPPVAARDDVRAQLIDGLRRNFAWREADGTRTYFRSAPQAITRDADTDARLLRGSALVNANLLRAEAEGVLAIVDRLPDMLRFSPADPRRSSEERTRVRAILDQLVATASDPLGLNARRGQYQFSRLSTVLLDILLRGGVLDQDLAGGLHESSRGGASIAFWRQLHDEQGTMRDLRARTSAVRDEEVRAELTGLGLLMDSIQSRVSNPQAGQSLGVAAGRLEELLTAADGAAANLEHDLSRFGSTPAEQEVHFLGRAASGVSLAQFIGWVRALCMPFVGVENAAAALTAEELAILSGELKAVWDCADQFAKDGTMPTGFGGVRRQFDELKRFIDEARQQADALK